MNIILGIAGTGGVLSAIKSVSSSLGSDGLSGALMAAGAAAVIGLGVAVVKASGDFQQQMLKNQALAGLTADQYTAMSQQILTLSPQLGQAPSDLAKGLYNVLSAGIPASQAMNVLKLATESATIGMTDSATVTDALTSALNAFSVPATQAQGVMDAMNATVTSGKMQWAEYAHVIGVISVTAHAAGIGFDDMNAALATMTATGLSAQRASMDLNFLMRDLGPNAAKVAENAGKMGLSFDLAKFQSDNLYQKLQYLQDITHGNQQEMLKLTGGAAGWMAAQMILANNGQLYANALNNIQNASQGAGATAKAWAVTQEGLNVQMAKAGAAIQVLLITLGNMLVPAITGVVSALSPLISQFASWITDIDHARPILIALAVVILAVLVPAVASLAVSVIAATWPIILVGVAVAGLAALFQHFYETNAGFRSFMNAFGADMQRVWGWIQTNVGPIIRQIMPDLQALGAYLAVALPQAWAAMMPMMGRIGLLFQDMGAYLKQQFLPVWTNLVATWQTQILPLLGQLWQAIQPLIPVFEKLGMIIGALLVIAIGVLWAAITGLVKALAGLLSQLGPFIGGIVQMITGAIQVISGIITFFVDLLTGKWNKLGGDLAMMAQGILNIFGGLFQALGSLVRGALNAIGGFFSGFIDGIIGFFQHLFERLVGKSIVPDMINAIVGWFASLPGTVFGIVDGFVGSLITKFQILWKTIVSDAKNIFGTIGDAIAGILKGAINGFIINPINAIISRLDSISVDTPFGHVGFSIPYIPRLAAGGTAIAPGLAVIGERGPELAYLPTGASVIPLSGGAGASGGRFGQQTTNYITINLATMARSQSEVSRLVDLFETELARRFRLQTSGYNSGNIF
jgi:TP901 family phage tail tape measure protein